MKTLVALLLAVPLTVLAAKGGEGGNANCNGVGNVNSPCTGGGGGNVNQVPEPGSLLLVVGGLAALVASRKLKKKFDRQ